MRIKIIRVLVAVLFLLIASTLFYVQAIRGPHYFNQSLNNRIRVVPLEGWRGKIRDRNGNLLADSRLMYEVMVVPQDIKDFQGLFAFLGEILRADKQSLVQTYQSRKITPFTPVIVAEDISQEQAIVLAENRYRFPSLIVQEGTKRYYPLGEKAGHVTGYVGKINPAKIKRLKEYGFTAQSIIGYSGVEEYYDQYLKGDEGGLQIEVNSRGQQVRLLGLKEPSVGQDIALTIDSEIQTLSHDLLEGHKGVIITMDTRNGEIFSLASTPSFDPNVFVDKSLRPRSYTLFTDPDAPLLNRAIKGQYPPGSVFKLPVAFCALDAQKITEHTTFDCEGYHELGGIRFGCTHVHGNQNLIEAIAHSCNIYFYQLGLILGEEKISECAQLFGLGTNTHVDLPYEEDGFIPSRQHRRAAGNRWFAGDTLNISIGQGEMLTTPLQLVKMAGTIANDGTEVQPHLIKDIGGKRSDKYDFVRDIRIDPRIFETVKRGMRATVTNYSGTAHALAIDGLHVAGKTGTAQSAPNKESHAWFVGYAKGQRRQIAFCVFLEYGGSSQNANLVARQLLMELKDRNVL